MVMIFVICIVAFFMTQGDAISGVFERGVVGAVLGRGNIIDPFGQNNKDKRRRIKERNQKAKAKAEAEAEAEADLEEFKAKWYGLSPTEMRVLVVAAIIFAFFVTYMSLRSKD